MPTVAGRPVSLFPYLKPMQVTARGLGRSCATFSPYQNIGYAIPGTALQFLYNAERSVHDHLPFDVIPGSSSVVPSVC